VASSAASAATASAASAPRATTVRASPAPASSAMIDTTLRAFASRAPRRRRTSAAKRRAAAATAAAGRACSPVRAPTVTGDEVTASSAGGATAARRRGVAGQVDLEQHVVPRHDDAVARPQRRHAVHVRDDDRGEQAARAARHRVHVEAQERRPRGHARAGLHERGEALAAQRHRVEPHVDDELQPVRLERHRVPGAVHLPHRRVARCDDRVAERVDRHAVAGEPLGEDRVRHLVERHDDARDGAREGDGA
jgi:hypothetical protein